MTDPVVAEFLKNKLRTNKNKEFLFDITDAQLDKIYANKIEPKNKQIKIKDLRTYTATKMAKNILLTDKTPPPPLPDNPKKIKSLVKSKLKNVYEQVSQHLNNTPAMAKNSYIHPEIIKNWLINLGVKPKLIENTIKSNDNNNISLMELMHEIKSEENIKMLDAEMNPQDLEDCDVYNLPDWWDNDKI